MTAPALPAVDDLLAPATEMLRRLKQAVRGRLAALPTLLLELRALLAAEERWLLPELARAVDRARLDDLGGRLRGMEGMIERLLQVGTVSMETPAILATLQATLARHLRAQRRLLAAVIEAGLLRPGERLARFTRRAWTAVRGNGAPAVA